MFGLLDLRAARERTEGLGARETHSSLFTEVDRGHWVRSRVWGQEQELEAGGLEQIPAFLVSISLGGQSTCESFVVDVSVYSPDAGSAQ